MYHVYHAIYCLYTRKMHCSKGIGLWWVLSSNFAFKIELFSFSCNSQVDSPISVNKVLERYPYGVSSLTYLDGIEHAGVAQLRQHARQFEFHWRLLRVRLNAAHEPWVAARHRLQQLVQAVGESGDRTRHGKDDIATLLGYCFVIKQFTTKIYER